MNNKKHIIFLLGCALLLVLFTYTKKEHFFNKKNKKQEKFRKTLEDMKDILDKNKIPFFLTGGTCLGAHREKQFIEHDQDIDLGIMEEHFHKVINIKGIEKKFYMTRYFPNNKVGSLYRNNNINNSTEICYVHKETKVRIDLFTYFKKNDEYIHYSYGSSCEEKPNKKCVFKDKFKLELINFFGKIYNIPSKDLLVSQYGKDWNIPKKFTYKEGLNGGYKNLQ